MPKRAHDESQETSHLSKRLRQDRFDRLSRLSDELLLRILSYSSVRTLTTCQRVSKKFSAVAGDSQLWKAAYYNRFVRPRALRLPGLRDSDKPHFRHLQFSSKASKWLDDEHLLRRERDTDWKRQYKLRHNWSQGSCAMSEIPIPETASVPPLLVRYHNGIVFTLDSTDGLRAWSSKGNRELLASADISDLSNSSIPTCLSLDEHEIFDQNGEQQLRLGVGFADGRFCICAYERNIKAFQRLYRHAASSLGALSAIAISWPYLATMTDARQMSFYKFEQSFTTPSNINPPLLIHSAKSHTVSFPLYLSIRTHSDSVTASIAYTLSTYFSGNSVGIQELYLKLDGELIESRLAIAEDESYRPLLSAHPYQGPVLSSTSSSSVTQADRNHSRPTSLSYTHPYLLVAHPDNTLTLYLVTSTKEGLSVSSGSRLWGHTSSISGAHVGGRGRAVSVSSRGGELRVWELEGGMSSASKRKRLSTSDFSVRIRPDGGTQRDDLNVLNQAMARRGTGLGLALEHTAEDLSVTRGWVGFDEENVVVLKEQAEGRQALVVYDFT